MKKGIQLWGHEMTDEEKVPTFQFEHLLNEEEEVYKWLVTLATKTGLAKVENTPKELGQVIKLGERVGYLAQTSCGLVSNNKLFICIILDWLQYIILAPPFICIILDHTSSDIH